MICRKFRKCKYQVLTRDSYKLFHTYSKKEIQGRFFFLSFRGDDQYITFEPGFIWDGATFSPDKHMRLASAIHDSLCSLISDGVIDKDLKVLADDELKRFCLKRGMSKAGAGVRYKAVRLLGRFFMRRKLDELFELEVD